MKSYGNLSLAQSSPALTFIEPMTVSELQAYLLIPQLSPVDVEQTALLESMIISARELAEVMQGRDLTQKQYDLALDAFYLGGECPNEIQLRTPLVSVDLVQYTDSTGTVTPLVEGTDYIVDYTRGLLMPPYASSWPSFTPWPSSAVLIRYTSGYSTSDPFWSHAGQRVLLGMKLLISGWYNGRIPWAIGAGAASEYPYAVTALLSAGATTRAM